MPGHSEHIDGSDAFYSVTVLPEIFHISCQRRGITAHINDLLRCHLYDRLKAELITSLSWRIDNDHIGFDMIFFILFRKNLLGFSDEEFYIVKAVALRILSRVLDGSRDDLDAADLPRLLCKEG